MDNCGTKRNEALKIIPAATYFLQMPSLGMITVNSLTASDSVLIPVQAAYLPVKELEQLIMRIIHSKSLFYWFILKVFDIQMVNSLFVYETVG